MNPDTDGIPEHAARAALIARFDALASAAVQKAFGSEPELYRLQEILNRVASVKVGDDITDVLQTAIAELEKF